MPTVTLTVTLTIKEVENACMALARADPFRIYTATLIKAMETEARKLLEAKTKGPA